MTACGYRVGGQGASLPTEIKVIAVPAFENRTPWMRLEQRLTAAVMQEFIHRSRYRVVGKEQDADAVLRGAVTSATTTPVIFAPETGRASAVQVAVRVSVELRDRRTRATLYANRDFVFREQYEISSDLDSFFEERDPALDRLARDFAASLVSAVLENF
ncbi:MAG: LptE family protein [Acidobacteria bacterium]|nr:LptE family protein [Acidobacteriota bacterium]